MWIKRKLQHFQPFPLDRSKNATHYFPSHDSCAGSLSMKWKEEIHFFIIFIRRQIFFYIALPLQCKMILNDIKTHIRTHIHTKNGSSKNNKSIFFLSFHFRFADLKWNTTIKKDKFVCHRLKICCWCFSLLILPFFFIYCTDI
jgi:hypothetical protein